LSASITALANTTYSSDSNGHRCESFAAISKHDRVNGRSGSEVLKAYTNILNSCNGTDIDSCLSKFKAQPSELKSAQNQGNSYSCCLNVSGYWGEFAYIHGESYCIPPC